MRTKMALRSKASQELVDHIMSHPDHIHMRGLPVDKLHFEHGVCHDGCDVVHDKNDVGTFEDVAYEDSVGD